MPTKSRRPKRILSSAAKASRDALTNAKAGADRRPDALLQKRPLRERVAYFLETSPMVKIWVRLNQGLPIIALTVASVACFFAFQGFTKSRDDKLADAWKLVVSSAGKMFNQGQVTAMERLQREARASFAHVDLHGSNLRFIDLPDCDLSHANLAGADLHGAKLMFCDLTGADLSGADLSDSNLAGVEFKSAKLRGADLHQAKIDARFLYAADVVRANISKAKFVYATYGDDEDGERWANFSDTLDEDPDQGSWARKIAQTCVDKGSAADFGILKDQFRQPNSPCFAKAQP